MTRIAKQRSADQIYDELLVLRCADGDRLAFAELVQRWQRSLYGHALQLTGRPDAAQDAVQETWLAIVRQLSKLEDPAHFAGYAHRILIRRCADWTRGQTRRRRLREQAAASAHATQSPPTAEGDSDALRVREALAQLSPDRRTLLVLHYLHDLSIEEIADTLRVPIGTVKSRMHAARARLKRALETNVPPDDLHGDRGDKRGEPCLKWKSPISRSPTSKP